MFYSLLDNCYKSVDEIAKELMKIYKGADYEMLHEDATVFYRELADKGFVSVSDVGNECSCNPIYFSYQNTEPYILDIGQEGEADYQGIFEGNYSLSRVHIDISSRCNEECVHCYIPKKNKCNMMSPEVFDEVLRQSKKLNVLNVTLSGGEPMLNPFFKSFLLKCIEANFSINVLSNLTCFTDEILEMLVSNPLIGVQTSLYAMEANVHDSITQRKGSFKKTYEAIMKLHAQNVPMQINCPIMKQNVNSYREVLDFAASLNIEASADYGLFGCYDSSGSNLGCRISTVQMKEILTGDNDNESTYQETVQSIESKKVRDDDPICSVCKSSLCVANNGDVYPCEGWQKMVLGNINRESLRYIWDELPLTKHLRALRYRDFAECRICQDRKYCTTCLIMNANESDNDYMRVNPYMCEMAKIKRNAVERFLK